MYLFNILLNIWNIKHQPVIIFIILLWITGGDRHRCYVVMLIVTGVMLTRDLFRHCLALSRDVRHCFTVRD